MTDCDLSTGTCPLCGFQSASPIYRNCPAVQKSSVGVPPAGLGDFVAAGLAAIGITKERAQAVASAVGVHDCGCQKRQAALNAAGAKYLGLPPGSTARPTSDSPEG